MRGWIPVLVLLVVAPLLLLPTLDVFQHRLSAYGAGDENVGLAVNKVRQEIGVTVSNAVLTAATARDAARTTESTIYLAVGVERAYSEAELDALDALASGGATVLVFDDFGASAGFLARLGVQRVPGTIVPNEPGTTRVRASILDADVPLIAPAALQLDGREHVRPIGTTTNATAIDQDDDGTVDAEEPVGPFVVAVEADRGAGRIVLVSDVTILTNRIVAQDPSGAELLVRLVGASIPPGGAAVLVLDEGRHVQGLAEVPVSIARAVRDPLARPLVLGLLCGLALAGTAVAMRRVRGETVPVHDPGLDRPKWVTDLAALDREAGP